jgi:hypothetical protein
MKKPIRYAEGTSVSVDRSIAEIRKTISAYKASSFGTAENNNKAMLTFDMNDRRIRLVIDLPVLHKTKTHKGYVMGQNDVDKETRRLWRCLLLLVKSKLECVASGICTFEEAFLPHIVLPNGQTVAELAIPQVKQAYASGSVPPLLGYQAGGEK